MKRVFRRGSETYPLELEPAGDGVLRVRLPDGSEHSIRARRLPNGCVEIREGHRVVRVPIARGGQGTLWLAWDGEASAFTPAAETDAPGAAAARPHSGLAVAPMVGVIADVPVAEGDRVAAYQPVAVVEAMKVFATVAAPFAGVVRRVHVRKGDRVEHDAPLVEIAAEEHEEPAP